MKNLTFIFVVLLTSLVIFNFFGESVQDDESNAQEFALGIDNTAYFPTDNNLRFHCSDFEYFPLDNCLNDFSLHSEDVKGVIYTGNSQLHGINQPELGLNSTSKLLYNYLKIKSSPNRLVTLSVPNLNLQEQLLLNVYAVNRIPVTHLIIAASFDNTRETSIRDSLLPALKIPQVSQTLAKMKFGKKIIKIYGEKDNAGNDLSVESDNLQQRVESYLDDKLSNFWPAWSMRARLRFRSIVEAYQFRNRIFGITPNSIRKKIPARYIDNLDALEDLMKFSKDRNLKVLFYSPPIRSDQSLPYDAIQFQAYKDDVQKIVTSYGHYFFDFQDSVPSQYWGFVDETDSNTGKKEIDFMHFQGKGHEFLSQQLIESADSINFFE